jgi:hypothetical protein
MVPPLKSMAVSRCNASAGHLRKVAPESLQPKLEFLFG